MPTLSTHVLDTASGIPGRGVTVRLYRIRDESRELVGDSVTNADGRTDAPLLPSGEDGTGRWELVFSVGAYFARQTRAQAEPAFLDDVSVRFSMVEDGGHYHVPLLVSPWGYTTYRGS